MEAATGVALADVAIGHWRRRLVEERPQAFITGGCPYALKDNARIGEVAGGVAALVHRGLCRPGLPQALAAQ